jgi:predicted lipoprotein with Yx(FWY)xxD motif
MERFIKKIVSVSLVFAMLIAVAAPGQVQAKTTKKSVTLYVGEEYTLYDMENQFKSVSSSKKSVATVTKNKKSSYVAKITAKKPGKTTVTVKTKKDTTKYNITVKKIDITGTFTDMGDGNLLLELKNNTKNTFEGVDIKYVLKDSSGKTYETDKTAVFGLVAGKTVYTNITYFESEFTPDPSKCTVTASGVERTVNYTYKDASSDVEASVTNTDIDTGKRTVQYTVREKNNSKNYVVGNVYILIYDADGNLVNEVSDSINLSSNATDTDTTNKAYFGRKTDLNNLTYKIYTVAYYTK